jgi:hypothetical protein
MATYGAEYDNRQDIRDKVNELTEVCSGSGIDCEWEIEEYHDRIIAKNSYHGMNEHGYYDSWADFSLTVYFDGAPDWQVKFHGKGFRHKGWFCGLKDYLEDSFSVHLKGL